MEASKIKKVCHLTSAHNRYDVRIFQKECRSLAKHGFDVTLIVNDTLANETIDDVKIISTNFKPKNRLDRMLNSNKIILKLALEMDADIYHFHDTELLPIGNKLKKRGKQVIFDSHEHYPLQISEKEYIPKLLRKLIAKMYYIYETYSAKRFDAVVFPCTYDSFNPFENRAKKTVFIDNVPILEEFYSHYNEEQAKQNAICYVGSLTEDRGISQIIKAAHKAKVKLILGGMFMPDEYEKQVRAMVEFKDVDYKGYVNRGGVLDIYNGSFIGMCTILNVGQYNKSDNFNTKVYEYMSMGLPVIITDSPYVREVLKTYPFGIPVDPENVDEIANSISYLINHPEVSKEMGKNGRLAVKEKFNWAIEEQKLIELYESL